MFHCKCIVMHYNYSFKQENYNKNKKKTWGLLISSKCTATVTFYCIRITEMTHVLVWYARDIMFQAYINLRYDAVM